MKDELDRIISEINSHNDWNKNLKMRYAYIKIGQLVHKDTMFFYTVQNNLLSKEKEDIRYPLEEVKRLMTTDNLFDYKVVCKNSADMLVYVFKNCGIEAEVRETLVNSTYMNFVFNHYFVIATGDDDKKYFMTLNPDLPNIKLGRRTSKFAYEIKYIIDNDYIDGNNFGKQFYKGDKVDFSILSDEEIRKLDEQLGFINNTIINDNDEEEKVYTDYFFDLIKKAYESNSDYLEFVSHKTSFYEIVSKMLNHNKSYSEVLKKKPSLNRKEPFILDFKIGNVSISTWEDLKLFILNSVISEIYTKYNMSSEVDFEELLESKRYGEIKKYVSLDLLNCPDAKEIKQLGDLSPHTALKRLVELFKTIDIFENSKNVSSKELNEQKKRFTEFLNTISLLFADKRLLPNVGSLSSTYLTYKLIYAFNTVFDVGHSNQFNNIGLAEQVAIIKELLEVFLSDIKRDDDLPNYNEKKSPIRNRIISTVLFDKESKAPYYLIYVKNTKYGDNANMLMVYDLTHNHLYLDKTPIDIMSDYYVIKDADMKLIIEEFSTKSIEDKPVTFNI